MAPIIGRLLEKIQLTPARPFPFQAAKFLRPEMKEVMGDADVQPGELSWVPKTQTSPSSSPYELQNNASDSLLGKLLTEPCSVCLF